MIDLTRGRRLKFGRLACIEPEWRFLVDTMSSATAPVHRDDQHRFELHTEIGSAVAEYRRRGDTLVLTHTYVPSQLRHHGLAARLAEAAADYARKNGLSLRPVCSYMVWFFENHPEYRDVVSE